jgi:5-methylcytosine-specific restriction endonuclease McrA
MLPLDRRMSFEVEFNRVAIAVARMLVRQMDDTFLWLLHQDDVHSDGPRQRTAEVANRIVVLCRRLVEEIQRYERWDQIRREQQEQEVAEEDLPF